MFQLMSIHFWQCWKKAFLKYESLLWLRCLNNSFCICTEGLERLWKFYQHLKSFHPKIKYTVEVSREQMNFLDGKICQKEGSLQTYLYCKSKYTYQLLHFRYGHRYRYKNWISYGQVIRMKRTFSNHLPDLKIQNIRFVVGVIRNKWLIVRSKEFSPRMEKIYQEEMRNSIRMLALSWFWHSSSIKQSSRNFKKDTYKQNQQYYYDPLELHFAMQKHWKII